MITHRRILSPVRLPVPPPRLELQSGRRGSNPRPPPWQGGVLPLNYFRKMPAKGVEPSTLWLQIRCSTNWAKPAKSVIKRLYTGFKYLSIYFLVKIDMSHAGFEPATLWLKVRCSTNWANDSWWRLTGSNRWPPACKAGALPAELNLHNDPYGNRTRVTAVKGRCLNRLTNGPIRYFLRRVRDSNPWNSFTCLHDFQSCPFGQLGQLSKMLKTYSRFAISKLRK